MKTSFILSRLLCLVLVLAWTQSGRASTIFWGSNFQDNLYDSNGQQLDATYTFEMGTFGSFVPTYQNVDQWAANWHIIDAAYYPDSNGWNTTNQFFGGNLSMTTSGTSDSPDANPADVFTQGEVAYLWAFNSQAIVPSSEWALVTYGASPSNTGDPWVVPDPADTTGSYNWNLTDANNAIVGGANDVQGPGTYSATPGIFSLQTAVVPEPGSALLLLSVAATHLIRRTRRLTRPTMP